MPFTSELAKVLVTLLFQTTLILLSHDPKYSDDLVRQPRVRLRLRTYMTIMLTRLRIYMTIMLTRILAWIFLLGVPSPTQKSSTCKFGHMQFNIRQVPGKTLKGPAGVKNVFPSYFVFRLLVDAIACGMEPRTVVMREPGLYRHSRARQTCSQWLLDLVTRMIMMKNLEVAKPPKMKMMTLTINALTTILQNPFVIFQSISDS